MRLQKLNERLDRLTDAYLDGEIDKDIFQRRKESLLAEKAELEETAKQPANHDGSPHDAIANTLELASSALNNYRMGTPDEKRELLKIVCSNRTVSGKNVAVELSQPFHQLANRPAVSLGDPTGIRTPIFAVRGRCPNH